MKKIRTLKMAEFEHDYSEWGSRANYLKSLAEDNGVPLSTVIALSTSLGPEEDFDALVTYVEDEAQICNKEN
jgi:3-oxoacyl-ACP reductase-like protein